jgi:hypothetical protein
MTLIVLRTFVETDLPDAALQLILDAAEEDMAKAVGPEGGMIEQRAMEGQADFWTDRPVASVSSVTETDDDGAITTLVVSDYRLHPNKMRLTRLATGTNPASGWTNLVTVSYQPADLAARNRAIVQLVELDLAFRPGARSENLGDFSRTHQDYDAERTRIISAAQSRMMA